MKHYARLAKQKGVNKITKSINKFKQKRKNSINTYLYRHRGSLFINGLNLMVGTGF